MGRRDGDGSCTSCHSTFGYLLINNGFNDSAFAYCDACGMTALFGVYSKAIPVGLDTAIGEPLVAELEPLVAPCACGGRFRADAVPRCPRCRATLDPVASSGFIEANAPGTKAGWRWQRSWKGMYAIIIEDRLVEDPWKTGGEA